MKIKVNTDTKLVEKIRKKLSENGGYCPCKVVKNDDTRCMCKEFLDKEYTGMCHCGLYIKEEL